MVLRNGRTSVCVYCDALILRGLSVCLSMQGALQEKDSELSTVKSDREKLEKELQTILQREKEDKGAKSKGPGGMLHSALQQLQRELRRESMANEKLMVKAESLLKDGGKDLSGNSSSEEVTAGPQSEDSDATSDADKSESEDEQQKSEEEEEEQRAEEPVTYASCSFFLFLW